MPTVRSLFSFFLLVLVGISLQPSLGAAPTTCGVAIESGVCSNDFFKAMNALSSPEECWKFCKGVQDAAYFTYAPGLPAGTNNCGCYSSCPDLVNLYIQAYNGALSACAASSGVGDPHFVDANGIHFDFSGRSNKSYCLLSDTNIHLNALFGGSHREQHGGHKQPSWMRELSVSWVDKEGAPHTTVVVARRGREIARGTGLLSKLTVDNGELLVPTTVGEEVDAGSGFHLKLLDNTESLKGGVDRDSFSVRVDGLLEMVISVNAEMEDLRTSEEAEVHFNFKINSVKVTKAVHGILGQAFRPGAVRKLRASQYRMLAKLLNGPVVADGETGAGLLDGTPDDYKTSGIARNDCKFAASTWIANEAAAN